ncbi:hypothetical protein AKJ45_02655 [candidate division MSBL1 archaeon SCGC-AAA261F19]|uniref:precorrin-2 dehydrogenase n=1 Tax=candidate division MSBL1 archaeon SCGC-AAA261F19 TaxID=1698275 RepID=A0A133V9A9_9EURY|nr:hypothetical protein AKJ45_02655 [candidate division MSBL1 archaeon SCGC-AAA261F19]
MYLPLSINLKGKKALVIGAGKVGERRTHKLKNAGAKVTVIDKEPIKIEGVKVIQKELKPNDLPPLKDYSLVVVATNDEGLNATITREAKKEGILINRADDFKAGNVIFPATVKAKDGTISISTFGEDPKLTRRVKELVESEFSED